MEYIHVEELKKSFIIAKKRRKGQLFREKETVEALKGLSFDIKKGELMGYIGPNGAGKSTTVKILSGIMTPDSGQVLIDGRVPWENRKDHVSRIGVVFGQRMQLWWDVPIIDSFSLLKDIYRLPDKKYQDRLEELTTALNLGALMRTPLRQLSLGQRMRAELCGSLLHCPGLLFLDEPTIGLDAVSKLALREFLRWENQNHGTTILLTTHDMEDIAALCSRVLVLGHGRKLFDGDLPTLLGRYDTVRTITVSYEDPSIIPELVRSLRAVLYNGNPDDTGSTDIGTDPVIQSDTAEDQLRFTYSLQNISTAHVLSMLQEAGTIRELTIEPQNIDHLIAAMYKEMDL